jgi:hypothetical protein
MTMDNLVGPAGGQSAGNDAMSALLAQDWWAIALRGVFTILILRLLPENTQSRIL